MVSIVKVVTISHVYHAVSTLSWTITTVLVNAVREGYSLWISVFCVNNFMVKDVKVVTNSVVKSVRLTGH